MTCNFGIFKGASLANWYSVHRDCKKDRIHHFKCIYAPFMYYSSNCAWSTHYGNDYGQPLNFKCPHNGVIAGVASVYSATHGDRR